MDAIQYKAPPSGIFHWAFDIHGCADFRKEGTPSNLHAMDPERACQAHFNASMDVVDKNAGDGFPQIPTAPKPRDLQMKTSPTDQCIVLPFRPQHPQPFSGIGLALHFLLGNVLVLHTGLKEMWFGWRVKKIFPQQEAFQHYCRDATASLDLARVSHAQKVRLWIHGILSVPSMALHFFDGQHRVADNAPPIALGTSTGDRLIGFRSQFMAGLKSIGHAMPENQIQAALWPETIDRKGLDAVGRALETFYLFSAYGKSAALDTTSFQKAVAAAPESFMAHDLHGWALYRNADYPGAKAAFLTALQINPAGAGAMSGLMWCGIYTKDLEEALFWSGRKAEACRRDIEAARQACRRRYQKAHD